MLMKQVHNLCKTEKNWGFRNILDIENFFEQTRYRSGSYLLLLRKNKLLNFKILCK